MAVTQFEPGSVYTFNVYPSAIIPSDFKNVTVLDILGYDLAKSLTDIDAQHVNVFPTLPDGTPDDPSKYLYLRVKKGENITIVGVPWINMSTVVLVQSVTAVVTIAGLGVMDPEIIRALLVQNGFNNIEIKLM